MDRIKSIALIMRSWFDADQVVHDPRTKAAGRPESDWDRWAPFIFLQGGCLLVIFTGWSATSILVCLALYLVRMFAITAFFHRYFSHRTFKTSRIAQFVFAMLGGTAAQKGALWWASHHRHHHASSDQDDDVHSPVTRSFIWSHIGWITASKNLATDYDRVRDFDDYPELRFLNRFDWLMPSLLLVGLYLFGEHLRHHNPLLHTSGAQLVAWGFFVSTTILFHATASINSLSHCFGYQRFDTGDHSRNNPLLALVTFGEGWHNNHHKFSHCARQGFAWWEIDLAYMGLFVLARLHIISDLKPVPASWRTTIAIKPPEERSLALAGRRR